LKTFAAIVLLLTTTHVTRADAIDDYVNGQLSSQHIPGLALAIIQDSVLVRAQGYGLANVEHQVPVHADTIFQSGSIGKQFTATVVMLLVEDGKLHLDESVRTYLPQAPKNWAPITIRHLLTHTSGLPANSDADLRRDYTDDELLEVFYRLKTVFPAGTRWTYSNVGYELLGIIVKRVTGNTYSDILAERVFKPLNMQTARLISDRDIVINRAAGYELEKSILKNQNWVASWANATADGSLYLTVLDFAKWDEGLRAERVLKQESWAEVYRPASLSGGRTYPYGFGWFLEESNGQVIHRHDGAWQGFTTSFIRYLTDGVSIVVLDNLAGSDPDKIARHVAGLYDKKLAMPPGSPENNAEH
jgi:CubicO group peptidase (beta-lactamase class C family)